MVVAEPPGENHSRVDSLSVAQTDEEIRAVEIVDLDLSVRCRLALSRIGVETVGQLLELTKSELANRIGHIQSCVEEIDTILTGKGLKQREG